ncbi:MAG: hypothetical protein WBP81_08015 [Solirubrobacteraceae bacterium]
MSSTTLSDTPVARDRDRRGAGAEIYLAFVPWVLFTLITQHDTLKAAAVAALGAAVVVSLPSLLRGRPKLLELGAVLAFAGFTVAAFAADPAVGEWIAHYARAIAAGGLALIAFGSLLFTPFTEQYARESVPRQFWNSREFKEINRRLTAMWGWVFVAMVPSHLIAGAIDTHRASTIFNWVIPIALIVWAAKRTASVTAAAVPE